MRFRIKIGVLATTAVLALPLLGVARASAVGPEYSDTIDVTGHAAVVIPNPTVPPTITAQPFTVNNVLACRIKSDFNPTNDLVTDPVVPPADSNAGDDCKNNFTASGTVRDTFCGTGKVDITFKVYELKNLSPAYEDSIGGTIFNIQFVAGQATNVNINVDETEPNAGLTGNAPKYTAQASGTIDAAPDPDVPGVDGDDPLLPPPGGDGDCTDGFTFHAHLVVIEDAGSL